VETMGRQRGRCGGVLGKRESVRERPSADPGHDGGVGAVPATRDGRARSWAPGGLAWRAAAVVAAVLALAAVAGAQPGTGVAGVGGAPPPGSGTKTTQGFVRVIDGDTVEALIEAQRVGIGFIGIAAPMGNTPCGVQATSLLQTLARGGLALDEDPQIYRDQRGRRMYYPRLPAGGSVTAELVRAGVARATGEGAEAGALAALETAAQAAHRGCLWSGQ
jgi:endonuclease YncB( thermonuclease family)